MKRSIARTIFFAVVFGVIAYGITPFLGNRALAAAGCTKPPGSCIYYPGNPAYASAPGLVDCCCSVATGLPTCW